ncbi:MAG: hypothetical protein ACSLE2_18755 [Lysobacterales bacterium]
MGWYFSNASKSDLIKELTSESIGAEWTRTTIAHAVRGSVLWTVNQVSRLNGQESRLFIGCDLLQKSGGYWGHKPLSEEDGPYYYSCPLKYLDMVPVQNADWRVKVREYHARRTRQFETGQRVEVIGCTVPWVRITSANPLTGEYAGVRYNLKRSLLGEVLQDAEVPDGQFLTGPAKSSDRQEKAVIGA